MAQIKRSNHRQHGFDSVELIPLLLFSLLLLYIGVTGIIENKSPENLSSVGVIMAGFFTYFKYHVLILAGALALTFSVWLFSNKSKC